MNHRQILPGKTIGVLGSGQLGRMFAIAARRLGYRVHVLSPDDDTPTGQVADVEIRASYDELDAVARFARAVDVVTFEFENVPLETVQAVESHAPVRPGGRVLHTTQNRLREKTFLREAGFPVTPFHTVRSENDLNSALQSLESAGVIKTAAWGYDGKGQRRVDSGDSASEIWSAMNEVDLVLEKFVDFDCELSVVVARGIDGICACYPPIQNIHRDHILDVSLSPAGLSPRVASEATEIARHVVESLEVVGVLCVEFFLTCGGELLINELAPRPHNSGHLTIDAHVTCQFEQQVRAVCGLPLGSVQQLQPAAMVNLLGDLWRSGEPNWSEACSSPSIKLHLYGKHEPRPGRKMGHLTALSESVQSAEASAKAAREALVNDGLKDHARPVSAAPTAG
ncbi:MAG: 5-(carboxyamino)imidazole ribonucleotide synthase [Planctomycetales bacterium]|nr:5-(carboxyamino)imidazole ribonucleotide synthase [Planctomycetales bacterium]